MTITEMYNNNAEIKELDENIENHNAVIASERTVGEDYFTQLKEMKEKRENMSIISEEQIDQKVAEYEKKVEEFEKNNNRMKELAELIETHNSVIASGRPVTEEYFEQINEYKKELSEMEEVPENKIVAYKRELAVAYKERINTAPEKNRKYDEVKENIDNKRAMFASGRIVGEKYGENLEHSEKQFSNMKRISDADIEKWEKLIAEVDKEDKKVEQLKELIDTQQSFIVSGAISGTNVIKKQDELKKELKEKTKTVKDFEEKDEMNVNRDVDLKEMTNNIREAIENAEKNENLEQKQLPAIIKKENILSRFGSKISDVFKKIGSKITGLFSKREAKNSEEELDDVEVDDTAKAFRDEMKNAAGELRDDDFKVTLTPERTQTQVQDKGETR
jgi:chromosome segregation ATPase